MAGEDAMDYSLTFEAGDELDRCYCGSFLCSLVLQRRPRKKALQAEYDFKLAQVKAQISAEEYRMPRGLYPRIPPPSKRIAITKEKI